MELLKLRYQIKNGYDETIISDFDKLEIAIRCCKYYDKYKPYIYDNETHSYIFI